MDCCDKKDQEKLNKKGIASGIIYGLLPHSFCILFILFSIIGATLFSTYVQKILFLPYFFPIIIIISLLFATISAYFYLKKNELFNKDGIIKNRNYLITLYLVTISVNILFIYEIFPSFNNYYLNKHSQAVENQNTNDSIISLEVDIPCSGHVSLIDNELRKNNGIRGVDFKDPNIFTISYDKKLITEDQILNLSVFQSFKAKKI